MSRDDLIKAIDKNKKSGAESNFVTPREDQGSEKAVIYLDDGEERELSGSGSEVEGAADQSSQGGTITGPDPVPAVTSSPTRPVTNP